MVIIVEFLAHLYKHFKNVYFIFFIAGKRPPVEEIYKWLDRNRKWIVQKLFSGADPELIAHALAGKQNSKHF